MGNSKLKLKLAFFGILFSASQLLLAPPISRAATRLLMPMRPTTRNMFAVQQSGQILPSGYVHSFSDQRMADKAQLLIEPEMRPLPCMPSFTNPFSSEFVSRIRESYAQAKEAKYLKAAEDIQAIREAQMRKDLEAEQLKIATEDHAKAKEPQIHNATAVREVYRMKATEEQRRQEQETENLKKTQEQQLHSAKAVREVYRMKAIEQKRREQEAAKYQASKPQGARAQTVRLLDVEFHASPEKLKFLVIACVAVSLLCAIGLKDAFDKICAQVQKKKEDLYNRVTSVKAEWEAANNARLDLQITELKQNLAAEQTRMKDLIKNRKNLAKERMALDAQETSFLEDFSKTRSRKKIDKVIDRLTKQIATSKETIESLGDQINSKLKERGIQESWLSQQNGYSSMVRWFEAGTSSLEGLKNSTLEALSITPKAVVLSTPDSARLADFVRSVVDGESVTSVFPKDVSLESVVQGVSNAFQKDFEDRLEKEKLKIVKEPSTTKGVGSATEQSGYSWKTKAIVPAVAACWAIAICSKR